MNPVPKPRKKTRRRPKPLKRTPIVQRSKRSKKSGGALFWKVKDKPYRDWIRNEHGCLLTGKVTTEPVTPNDTPGLPHRCWGAITPAHVGKHQATGAPDRGVIVPLCKAAHTFYDEHRAKWMHVSGWTEPMMLCAAENYETQYRQETEGT